MWDITNIHVVADVNVVRQSSMKYLKIIVLLVNLVPVFNLTLTTSLALVIRLDAKTFVKPANVSANLKLNL